MDLGKNEKRAMCGICSAGCWVIVTYDESGKIANVRADETTPLGSICRVGEQSPAIVYSKDRLRHPMKRVGPKGTYDFERITWDEAFETIVERLQTIKAESGPEATAIYTGSGSFELAFCDMYQPEGVAVSSAASVLFPFGSPNTLGVGALCYVSFAMIAPHVTMGRMYIDSFTDIENAELIVVWGKNPATHCPRHDFDRIEKALQNGAQIVVIDPRKTQLAKHPDAQWIPIRPGSDGALALGMCNVLFEEELYDEDFVKNWTVGFGEFNQYVQHFRPEVVENITSVPAETVRTLARRMATSNGVAPVMYSGLEYAGNGVQTIRAVITLWAMAGQLDVPGGWCFSMRENQFPSNRRGLIANPDVRKAAGHNNFPVYTKYRGEFHANILPKAVLEEDSYPIRVLISMAASIITSWPQSDIWRKTLEALDFLVCVDRQLTADSACADIVLPATTYYEIESYMRYGSMFRIRDRVIDPVGEARNDFFILSELARRLGYGHLYPQNETELLERALDGSGFTVDEVRRNGGMVQIPTVMMQYKKWEKGLLREDGWLGFETPSGKFEITSSILDEHGYDALPVYTEPSESPLSQPGMVEEFPLVFNSGARSTGDIHTLHLSIPALKGERPVPTVMINTADAKRRGIQNGDPVLLKTRRGQVNMYAIVTDDIVPGAIEADAMGGSPLGSEEWQNACVNDLTDLENYDPISGFPVYKALLCEVVKAPVGPRKTALGWDEYRSKPMEQSLMKNGRREVIYLDHNATTPIADEVKAVMTKALEAFGNPSSIYAEGKASHTAIENARRSVALLVGCTARRIIFTGCGSESNNLAIKGTAFAAGKGRNHIVTSAIEHPSVLGACRWLEQMGYELSILPVDRFGCVDPADLEQAITERTCLVTIMLANNETGSIQPIQELAAIARERGVLFHTDAVQAAGKIALEVEELGVDFLSMSAHKFHGPKGVGVLYVRKGIEPQAIIHGGYQENGLRAGTENTMGIIGVGKAAELALNHLGRMESHVKPLREQLHRAILDVIPEAKLNGHPGHRLPNTLNLTLPGIRGESLVMALDRKGISISSGSACRSGHAAPSGALMAMGIRAEDAHCTVRISLGLRNTAEEIDRFAKATAEVIRETTDIVRFVSCR